MRDYICLGPTPSDEPCASVGEPDYHDRAMEECRRFIKLLRETFGPEPDGAWLSTTSFPHDFGTYFEVVCSFNPDMQESVDYALHTEDHAPATWEG